MPRRAYPRRYAQAIFEIAQKANELDRWQSDLQSIAVLVSDAGIKAFLESPKLHFKEKAKLLSDQLEGINPLALNLVMLLVNRGRLHLMGNITAEYQRRLDGYRSIEHADVSTAVALDKDEVNELTERLGRIIGKKVVIEADVVPAIIGGMVVKVSGKSLDGSIKARLEALKKELIGKG
ncbi:MAG: F0F1 ATP synthase subunit delta [Chloroflexota bacterium]